MCVASRVAAICCGLFIFGCIGAPPADAGSRPAFYAAVAGTADTIVGRVALAAASSPFLFASRGAPNCDPSRPLAPPCRVVTKLTYGVEPPETVVVRMELSHMGDCNEFRRRIRELSADSNNLRLYIDTAGAAYGGADRIVFDGENWLFDPSRKNSSFNKQLLAKGSFGEVDCTARSVTFTLPIGK